MYASDPYALARFLTVDWTYGLVISAVLLFVLVVWWIDERIYRARDSRREIPRRSWDQIAHGREMRALWWARKRALAASAPWRSPDSEFD